VTFPLCRPLWIVPLLVALAWGRGAAAQQPGVLRGRVIAAGEGTAGVLRVFVRGSRGADSAMVDGAGRFSVALPPLRARDTVEVVVDAADPEVRRFHPARVVLGAAEVGREHELVLVPLVWTVRGGRYAGSRVEVRVSRAFAQPCGRCASFYRWSPPYPGPGRAEVQGWPRERFPLRVAFNREWSGVEVTARDSGVFWREAAEVEAAFGDGMFRPARYAETLPRDDDEAGDVIVVWFDPELRGSGGFGTAVAIGDDIEFGDLRLRRGVLDPGSPPGLVPHELMHTLGYGHTCAFRSVLADVSRCPELRAAVPTPEDVAYVQLADQVRALQHAGRERWAFAAALAGERILRERRAGREEGEAGEGGAPES
jgi:hypothetical protein